MTDKELFEKTEKALKLKEKTIVNTVYKKGKFNKIISEIRSSQSPGDLTAAGSGFLSRVAAAIPGTRGHRMRSAQARTMEADAKKAEIEARSLQQKQMQGKSTQTRQYEDWCRKKETQMKLRPLGAKDQEMYDKHCTLSAEISPVEPTKPGVNFKVGDTVLVKTKKNPNAEGKVTALFPDNPGHEVQVKIGKNAPYAFDKRNISLQRGINKESVQYIYKKYK